MNLVGDRVDYSVNLQLSEVWNDPKKLLPYLREWVQNQRWTGTSTTYKDTIIEKDEFILFNSDSYKFIGFLVELITKREDNPAFTYFVPIEMARSVETSQHFPIHLKCQDQILSIRSAESNPQFFQILLEHLTKGHEIQSANSNSIQFKPFSSKLEKNLKIKSNFLLGDGNTTNTLYKITCDDNTQWVCKIYRILSRNPEIKMLKMLYDEGFHQVPQPLGLMNIKIHDSIYSLMLFSEYVEAQGDGGLPFWKNLNTQIAGWKIGRKVQQARLKNYCKSLGQTVANLHYHSSKINDAFFKPEKINQNDIENWKQKIRSLFQDSFNNLKGEFDAAADIRTRLNHLNGYVKLMLKSKAWDLLMDTMKIKIHQDLHLAQMLTTDASGDSSFIILDFEGDPLLSIEEKFQKDPIFRDLASIHSAFHYIKINALREHFKMKYDLGYEDFIATYFKALDSHIEITKMKNNQSQQLISFSKQWEYSCQELFLTSYLNRLKTFKLNFKLDLDDAPGFKDVLRIFRMERFVKELYYESLFRKSNVIIPILGLVELEQGASEARNYSLSN